MLKDLKYPLLIGAIFIAAIFEISSKPNSTVLLFVMGAVIPVGMIWLVFRVLKHGEQGREGFSDEQSDSWYEQ